MQVQHETLLGRAASPYHFYLSREATYSFPIRLSPLCFYMHGRTHLMQPRHIVSEVFRKAFRLRGWTDSQERDYAGVFESKYFIGRLID